MPIISNLNPSESSAPAFPTCFLLPCWALLGYTLWGGQSQAVLHQLPHTLALAREIFQRMLKSYGAGCETGHGRFFRINAGSGGNARKGMGASHYLPPQKCYSQCRCLCYSGLLRFFQRSLTANLSVNGKAYVIIPLLGRFKNELGDQYHLIPLIVTTN